MDLSIQEYIGSPARPKASFQSYSFNTQWTASLISFRTSHVCVSPVSDCNRIVSIPVRKNLFSRAKCRRAVAERGGGNCCDGLRVGLPVCWRLVVATAIVEASGCGAKFSRRRLCAARSVAGLWQSGGELLRWFVLWASCVLAACCCDCDRLDERL